VELALDGGDASLLPLLSVGVRVYDDVSVSTSWPAFMAFSIEAALIAVDFRLLFCMRLFPETEATDWARSEGQAHSEDFGIV
jgi:hypothetical protein